ncbi:MAG: hypothetical protein SPE24_08255 [Erysipelotrichaceae bacterium]|nr:hypothetical protein [Erysipelotrichaceae bacterium]
MGFRQGAYAKIWSVEDKGNYSVCNLSISKKNKDTDKYDVEFQDGFVRLVGTAHTDISGMDIPENGLSIKISSCDVTNNYDADKKKLYTNYVIFGFEIPDNSGTAKSTKATKPTKSKKVNTKPDVDDVEDELPFN